MTDQSGAEHPVLLWLRNDLRLADNPAVHAAVGTGRAVVAFYIVDEESAGVRPLGGASRWWLHHSLTALSHALERIGGRLDVFEGASRAIVAELAERTGATGMFWNRRAIAAERAVDDAVQRDLAERGIVVHSFNGCLLHEPADIRTKTGGAFKVYTPFLRASLAAGVPGTPLPAPTSIGASPPLRGVGGPVSIANLRLLPTRPDWAGGLRETWTPGEAAAARLMQAFLQGGLSRYGEDRNRPAIAATSRLSPHLRFGEISPRQVVTAARHAAAGGTADEDQVAKFVSEVIWRDFAYNLLAEHPDMATVPVQDGFRTFPYRVPDAATLDAWRFGRTGYPIVDAGMRQLWETGVMHNRVRMITASFLVKHLLVDWRVGEAWFWDTLCDADPASNPVNWQWVAGSGADPAPYFRIFNPTLQGEKFDGDRAYIRLHVPELAAMPAPWIHTPCEAPPEVLDKAGVVLGATYPRPIVEHEVARARALAALATMRDGAARGRG